MFLDILNFIVSHLELSNIASMGGKFSLIISGGVLGRYSKCPEYHRKEILPVVREGNTLSSITPTTDTMHTHTHAHAHTYAHTHTPHILGSSK